MVDVQQPDLTLLKVEMAGHFPSFLIRNGRNCHWKIGGALVVEAATDAVAVAMEHHVLFELEVEEDPEVMTKKIPAFAIGAIQSRLHSTEGALRYIVVFVDHSFDLQKTLKILVEEA